MKKIFCVIVSLLLFTTTAMAASAGYFSMGKAAFNNKDYNLANTYFVKALTQNPNDATCRYYYAQTLTYLKNYKQARIEYTYVTQLVPGTTLDQYAKQSITYIDSINKPTGNNSSAASSLSGDNNYLTKAITVNGELMTWDLGKMPIKVYVDNSYGVSSMYVNAAKEALNMWQSASEGLVSFLYINESQYADLTIKMQGSALKTENQILGLTQHTSNNGYIGKVKVTLYTIGPNYKRLTPTDVYNVALHEFGHMLGIWGHSDEQTDILYALYNPSAHKEKMQLSLRDKNTIKMLYSVDKNPYSTASNSITKMLGSKESRMNSKIEQELAYVKQVPGNPIGYINVGNTYSAMNNQEKAIEYYKKALAIDANSKDANAALGKIYFERNDLKNAEIYYKKLIQVDSKNPHSYCNLINLYINNNRFQLARASLSSLLYRNPSARNEECIKQIMKKLNVK